MGLVKGGIQPTVGGGQVGFVRAVCGYLPQAGVTKIDASP